MLQELAELGMAIARAAASQTLSELNAAPVQPAAPQPETQPAPPPEPAPPTPPLRDPGLLFTRASHAVRATIALAARLAAPDPKFRPLPPPDTRRALIRDELNKSVAASGHDRRIQSDLRQETAERLEDERAADPDGARMPAEILLDICKALDLPYDITKLRDPFFNTPNDPASWLTPIPDDDDDDGETENGPATPPDAYPPTGPDPP